MSANSMTNAWSFGFVETPRPFGLSKSPVCAALKNRGVYFVNAAVPAQRVKVSGHLADNTASRIVGIIPELAEGQWLAEAVTQFSTGSSSLKAPRVIRLSPVLTVA